ncbi:hypothetical protein [Nocardia sp. X0981]
MGQAAGKFALHDKRAKGLLIGTGVAVPVVTIGNGLINEWRLYQEQTTPEALDNNDLEVRPGATGLGPDIDEYLQFSPTMAALVKTLRSSGWTIGYGHVQGEDAGFVRHATKIVTLDPSLEDDPETALQILAHELGHARPDGFQPELSVPEPGADKEQWIKGEMFERYLDEADAELFGSRLRAEIVANQGPAVANYFENSSDRLYRDISAGKTDWAAARHALAKEFEAEGERWAGYRTELEAFWDGATAD